MNIKIELIKLGKKQVDLIPELKARGFKVKAPELCVAISDSAEKPPKMVRLHEAVLEIIEEWKKGA